MNPTKHNPFRPSRSGRSRIWHLVCSVAAVAISGAALCSPANAAPLGVRAQWTPRDASGVGVGATAAASAVGGGWWLLVGADLVRYDAQGHELYRRHGSLATSPALAMPGHFMAPVAMTSDAAGRVYVSDTRLGSVQVFDADGALSATYSGLAEPWGVATTPSGQLLVSDDNGIEVYRLADGAFETRWTANGTRDSQALAVKPDGDVYAVSDADRLVYKFRPDGTPAGSLGGFNDGGPPNAQLGPSGLAAMSDGGLWVSDPDHRQLVRFDAADAVQRRCVPRTDGGSAAWRVASDGQTLLATSFGGARAWTVARPALLESWSCKSASQVQQPLLLSDVHLRPSRVSRKKLARVKLTFHLNRPATMLVNFKAHRRIRQILFIGRAKAHRHNLGRAMKRLGLRRGTYHLHVAAQTATKTSRVFRLTLKVR